jgi:streptogramin lyase
MERFSCIFGGMNIQKSKMLQMRLAEGENPLISFWHTGCRLFALRVTLLFILGYLLLTLAPAASAQASYSFPTAVTVGGTPAVESISVNIQTGGNLGSVEVLTMGTQNLDFTLATTSCAISTSYSASQTCNVSVQFAPMYPGVRRGAILLLDTSGTIMATQTLYGIGQGPLSVMEAGELSTVAGNGDYRDPITNGSPALSTPINVPIGVGTDGAGDLFYADSGNNVIRELNATTHTISTVAGTGTSGYTGDGYAATSAQLNGPTALVLDGAGNIYFADSVNNVIREIILASGKIVTIAGTGTAGYRGDTGAATTATLNNPQGLGFDASGDLYIADTYNNAIREVNATTGTITTVAGTGPGAGGFSPNGTLAINALLNTPWGVFVTPDGSLYIADFGNNVIRKVSASNGEIKTVAGTGTPNYTGDGGPAIKATLNRPSSMLVDAAGDLYISDSENNVVRKVNGTTQTIVTIAGNGNSGYSGDGYDANAAGAAFYKPYGMSLDGASDLFISDSLNLRIREVSGPVASIFYQPIKETKTSAPITQTIEDDGNATLNIASIVPTTNSAIDPASTTCLVSTPVMVGSTCNVGAEFKPLTLGLPVMGLITINSDSANTPGLIDLTGNSLNINPTTTIVTGAPNPAALGAAVTFTATVSNGTTQPLTGTVGFYDGTTLLGGVLQNLNSSTSTATLITTTLTLGLHSITAVYSGDTGDATSTSTPAYPELIKPATIVVLTGAPLSPSTVYQLVTFTATVSPVNTGGSVPTGNVVFSSDGTTIGTVALNSSGVATFPTALLPAGNDVIVATYAGDPTYFGSSSIPYDQLVSAASSTISLSTSSASVLVTVPVTFTATVAGTPTSTPTGNVVFNADGTAIGTVALNTAGVATFTISTLATGAHTITAVYQGDSDYATSTSLALTETIQKISTNSIITTSSNLVSGAAVQFTVTINAANSTSPNIPITGTVNLMEGATLLGTGTVTAIGSGPISLASATITYSGFTPGPQAINAVYSGDTNYLTSSSSATLQINLATTTTVLASTQNPILTLTPYVITAAVANSGSASTTGSVAFMEDNVLVGTAPLIAGVATLSLAELTVGTHAFVATYAGNSVDLASTSLPFIETVQLRPTTDALDSSATSLTGGQQITLTSLVRWTGPVTPTGTVTFFNGTGLLGTVSVDGNGIATITVLLSGATASVSSTYSGDINYFGSSSPATTVTISPAPNFDMSISPTTVTMQSGQNISVTITLTSVKGFTDNFVFGCLGQPTDTTCTFSQNDNVTLPSGGTQTVTLTIDTGNPLTGGAQAHNQSTSGSNILACFLPGSLLLLFVAVPRNRPRLIKKLKGLLLVLCITAAAAYISGCGGVMNSSTPPGTYSFQISAIGLTGVTQTVTMPMVVTK